MSKGYGIRQSNNVNAISTSLGAMDKWATRTSSAKANMASRITSRLKTVKVTLAPVLIKDSERSDLPISKLAEDPNQQWHLDDIEKSIRD